MGWRWIASLTDHVRLHCAEACKPRICGCFLGSNSWRAYARLGIRSDLERWRTTEILTQSGNGKPSKSAKPKRSGPVASAGKSKSSDSVKHIPRIRLPPKCVSDPIFQSLGGFSRPSRSVLAMGQAHTRLRNCIAHRPLRLAVQAAVQRRFAFTHRDQAGGALWSRREQV